VASAPNAPRSPGQQRPIVLPIIRPSSTARRPAYQRVRKSVNQRHWICLAFLAAGAACAAPEAPLPEGTIVVGFEAAPTTLDPRFATDEKSSLIGDLVYDGLTRAGEHAERLPDLAARWEASDPRRYVFHLRPGFAFHDGAPVTAADVKATYESVLDPRTASPKRSSLGPVERIDTPDPHTVAFRLREPFAPFLDATGLGILPAVRIAAGERALTIGSGPFRVARFARDSRIVLEAMAAHPDGAPRAPAIEFRIVPDDTVRALELRRGALHLVQNAVDPDMIPWLLEPRAGTRLELLTVPGTTFHYLGLNLRDPRLADLRVRRAIAHAIDRGALIRHLLEGFATPATGLLSPSHWAYAGDVTTYAYDPDAARALLDAAGHPDPDGAGPQPRLRLSYKGSTLQARRRFAEALQEQLAAVGVALDVRSYEWGTFYADIRRGNFQLYALAWVGASEPDIYHSLLHSTMTPPRGNNRGGYADPEIDRLTEAGRRTADPARRREIYGAVQRRVAETLPMIPLWWTPTVVVKAQRLEGFVPHPAGSLAALRGAGLAGE
jgi:peptide/nickel transport system substrate-binding protein